MNDDIIRQQALDPFMSFIVQAPAGSGKTHLLTSRILSLLAYRVQKPEAILAITFTRKAAQEMKRRVMKALQLGLGPEPEKPHDKMLWKLAVAVLKVDKQHGWELLQNPQRLRIMTIDALCSSITHQLPVSSRLGVNPKPVESADALYLHAAEQAIQSLLLQRDPFLETLLLHLDNNQNKSAELIAEMLSSRDQWLPLFYAHDTTDLNYLRETLEANIAHVLHAEFDKAMSMAWGVDWEGLGLYLSYAASQQLTASSQAMVESWIDLAPEFSERHQWRALCQWICTKEGDIRKTVDKHRGFPAPSSIKDKNEAQQAKAMKEGMLAWLEHVRSDAKACEAIKELLFLPEPIYSDSQWEVLKALFHVLPEAVYQLEMLFALRSEVDFTAIARCALTALGGEGEPTDVDLKLDDALQHILVDEFQDTSKPQFELIQRLVAFWENDGQKTLFLVGDPMQSIYRFRQAEVGGFLQAQMHGMGPVRLNCLSLTSNFRSERPVIKWINEKMPPAFSDEDDMYLGAITYSPCEAQHDASPGAGVYVDCVHADESSGPSLMRVLNNLINDVNIESIAILVRYRNHINDIIPALKEAQIPFQAVEMEKIIETPCVRQLFQLTQAYLNLANHSAWISVLLSPYCGLSLVDMTLLKQQASTYYEALLQWEAISGLSAEGKRILNRVAPILTAWIAEKHQLSLAQAIEGVWLALGGPASLPQPNNVIDAEPYFSLLSQCEQGGTLDIDVFRARLEKLYSNATKAAKVQIMTIHHAKGLEFDAVLIPGIERQPKASSKPLLLWEACPMDSGHVILYAPIHAAHEEVDTLYEFIWKKNKVREHNENARLLYVALTRARKQLHLFTKDVKPHPNSFLGALALEQVASSETVPEEDVEMIPLSFDLKRLSLDWENPFLPRTYFDQPIQLQSNPIDMNAMLPARFDDRALGVFIHQEMYLWSLNHALITQSIETHVPRWRAMLMESSLPSLHLAWVKEVMHCIQQDPKALDILYADHDAHSEYELTHVEEGVIKSLIIDRTYIDKNGMRVIVDYKTTSTHEGFEPHRKQLEMYAAAFRKIEQRPIRLCVYYVVTGECYEEQYEEECI